MILYAVVSAVLIMTVVSIADADKFDPINKFYEYAFPASQTDPYIGNTYIKYVTDSCANEGHPEALEIYEKASRNEFPCIEKTIGKESLYKDFEAAKDSVNKTILVIDKFCPKLSEIQRKCILPPTDALKSCNLIKYDVYRYQLYLLIFSSSFCNENKELFARTIVEKGFDCIEENKAQLRECLFKLVCATEGSVPQEPPCLHHPEYLQCYDQVLDSCPTSAMKDFMHAMYEGREYAGRCVDLKVNRKTIC